MTIWLRQNRRALAMGMVLPAIALVAGLALLLNFESAAVRIAGGLVGALGGAMLLLLALQMRVPRLAYAKGHLLVYLQGWRPIRVPIEIVECFLLGQAPTMLPGKAQEHAEAASVVIRLNERAVDWKHRDVKPALGKWCEWYITVRGTWCEPLNVQLIHRLNARLAEARAGAKQAVEGGLMTRLLVSVRDAAEARIALEAGVHLIDVKEPARGPLGAADHQRILEVLDVVKDRVPVSAAFGEFFAPRAVVACPGLSFCKWGLAGAADHSDWTARWASAINTLPPQTKPVAVLYADWVRARSPAPRELLLACRAQRVEVLLIDTFDKSAGNLLDVWSPSELERFASAARDGGMMLVLGGSLAIKDFPRVLSLKPDYLAVRGAACQGERAGPIDPQRVRALLVALEAADAT